MEAGKTLTLKAPYGLVKGQKYKTLEVKTEWGIESWFIVETLSPDIKHCEVDTTIEDTAIWFDTFYFPHLELYVAAWDHDYVEDMCCIVSKTPFTLRLHFVESHWGGQNGYKLLGNCLESEKFIPHSDESARFSTKVLKEDEGPLVIPSNFVIS